MAKGYWITFYRSISDPAALAATPNLPDRPWTRLVKNIRPAAPLRLDFGFHESNVVTDRPRGGRNASMPRWPMRRSGVVAVTGR
jgi:hypothetical protein